MRSIRRCPLFRCVLQSLALLVVAFLLPAQALAYQFEDPPLLDHRDQWGVSVGLGSTLLARSRVRGTGVSHGFAGFEIGLSRGLSYTGHELSIRLRPLYAGEQGGMIVLGGYRPYAGMDNWKTYADLDIVAPISPGPAIGVRLGAGVMYDYDRRVGLSLSGGALAAIGGAVLAGFDVSLGLQLRFD